MMVYLNSKAIFRYGDTDFFDIIACVLQGDTRYLFTICLDYVLRKALFSNNHLCLTLSKSQSRRYPTIKIINADTPDDLAAISDYLTNAIILWYKLEDDASEIGFKNMYIIAKKRNPSVITNTNLKRQHNMEIVPTRLTKGKLLSRSCAVCI